MVWPMMWCRLAHPGLGEPGDFEVGQRAHLKLGGFEVSISQKPSNSLEFSSPTFLDQTCSEVELNAQ